MGVSADDFLNGMSWTLTRFMSSIVLYVKVQGGLIKSTCWNCRTEQWDKFAELDKLTAHGILGIEGRWKMALDNGGLSKRGRVAWIILWNWTLMDLYEWLLQGWLKTVHVCVMFHVCACAAYGIALSCFVRLLCLYSPGARGSYPAPRVKVFFFADSGSPEGRLQFPGGWPSVTLEHFSESTRLCWAYTV